MMASIVDVPVDGDVPIDDTCGIGKHLDQHLVSSSVSGDIARVAFPHRLLSADVLTRKVTSKRCLHGKSRRFRPRFEGCFQTVGFSCRCSMARAVRFAPTAH